VIEKPDLSCDASTVVAQVDVTICHS